jgi:hypothetical protein
MPVKLQEKFNLTQENMEKMVEETGFCHLNAFVDYSREIENYAKREFQ